jgi:hypothetical protein
VAEARLYEFYVHKTKPDFRLTVRQGAPFPSQSRIENWAHTRTRSVEDTNPDVVAAIDEMGYCLFRIGFRFEDTDLS